MAWDRAPGRAGDAAGPAAQAGPYGEKLRPARLETRSRAIGALAASAAGARLSPALRLDLLALDPHLARMVGAEPGFEDRRT